LLVSILNTMQQKERQVVVGSTQYGTDTYFYKLWNTPELPGWKKFFYPIFKEECDVFTPLKDQKLTLLVPWVSMDRLEEERRRDPRKFAQEYLGKYISSDEYYFNSTDILAAEDEKLVNYGFNPPSDLRGQNIHIGVDVGSVGHYSAIVVVQHLENEHYIERAVWYKKGIELQQLEEVVDNFIAAWEPRVVSLDASGIGLHMAQNLKRKWGDIIQPLNFAQRITVSYRIKRTIRQVLLETLYAALRLKKIKLIKDLVHRHHIMSIRANTRIRSDDRWGHQDSAWALMLALLPRINELSERGSVPPLIRPVWL